MGKFYFPSSTESLVERIGNKHQNKNEVVDLHKDKLKLQNELIDTENDTNKIKLL